MMKLAERYGDIFYLQLGGRRLVGWCRATSWSPSSATRSRFDKRVWATLQNVRAFAGDGLFSPHVRAELEEGHNIPDPPLPGSPR